MASRNSRLPRCLGKSPEGTRCLNKALFPSHRADGSISVAARYSVSDASVGRLIHDYVAEWIRNKSADYRTVMLRELLREPFVVDRNNHRIDIVVEGRPDSRLWKDYLAVLVKDVPRLSGIAFEGFWDLVTNTPHPASLRRKSGEDNWPTSPL